MKKYILQRILFMILTFFILATLMFFMFRLIPGDPTFAVLSPALDTNAREAMKKQFGLDKPLLIQYGLYLRNVVTLDFGYSFHHSRPVNFLIAGKLSNTLILLLPALILAYLLGILGGTLIAWKRGTKLEIGAIILFTAVQSAPLYWLGILAIMVFSVQLDLFPLGHIVTPGKHFSNALTMYFSLDFFHHLALPLFVTTLYYTCFPLLLMRSSTLEVLGEDFIELCKMKGLSNKGIMYRHAMRNSLLPVTTNIPLIAGWAIAGSVILETVFSWPGLGLLMVRAIHSCDYPVVQASFLLVAVVTIVGNLVADLLYGLLDPRVVY